ncbi:hypothetical protein G9A89_021378 [Geosiphon pyriformis]|nr:hypothetical protein G9A89_021378 [Geosiphon pyriformis]
MKLRCFLYSLVPLFLSTTSFVLCEKTTQQLIAEGNKLLTSGHFEDALQSFGAAIIKDPSNYLSYFKRAATYLSLGRTSSALEDFTKSLELKPDFDQALLQRAKIYVKEGSYLDAKRDLRKYLKRNPQDSDAKKLLASLKEAEDAIKAADASLKSQHYDDCIKKLAIAIQISPHDSRLRLTKAQCHLQKGEVQEGARDLTQASKLDPSNLETLMRLSKLNYFALYQPEQSLKMIKQCTHYDPDNKKCIKIFRRIKKLEKSVEFVKNDIEGHRWQSAINKLFGIGKEKSSGLVKEIEEERRGLNEGRGSQDLLIKLFGWACKAYKELKDSDNAIKWCTSTLKFDPQNVDALVNRGEAYILIGDFEAAVRDYTKAQEIAGEENQNIREGFQKAHRLLKTSKSKDYYKILGVPRSASKKDIKKAFRKLAHQWHPDKYQGDLSRDEVEGKMSSINEAYEVLSNDETRERFDNGEDPNDPTGGAQHFYASQGNPFAHFAQGGGFPFGAFQFGSSHGDGKGGGQTQFDWKFAF